MSRTVEHIVDCHLAARALRAKGKNIWPYKINLQAILDAFGDEPTVAQVVESAHLLAKEIRRLPAKFFDIGSEDYDFSFMDCLEELEQMTEATLRLDMENTGDDACEVLNGWLSEVYDWADRNRIWTRG